MPPTSETIAQQMKNEKAASAPMTATETQGPATNAEPSPKPSNSAAKQMAAPTEASMSEMSRPGASNMEVAKPELLKPAMPRPEAKKPEMAKAETPKIEAPADTPSQAASAAMPTTHAPKREAPNVEEPKTDEPKALAVAAPEMLPQASAADRGPPVGVVRNSEGLRLTFSFGAPTPAASFRRGDTVWLVFDSKMPIDLDPIRSKGGAVIADVSRLPLEQGQAIRIRLNRPQMHSLTSDDTEAGSSWTLSLGDKVLNPPQPLSVVRNIADPARANVAVPLASPGPGLLHRLIDPDAGDTLLVVTAPPPIRGFIKRQDLVELSLLELVHGVAIHPNSDDTTVEVAPDRIMFRKPGGLTLSSADVSSERAALAVRPIFDLEEWRKNRSDPFAARQDELVAAASVAEPDLLPQVRLELARFYASRGMFQETAALAGLVLAEANPKTEESVVRMLHAIASILTGRPEQGLKDLATPAIGNSYDLQLWKAVAYARQGKWVDAREKFRNVDFAIASLPMGLQAIVTVDAMRSSIEIRDYSGAAKRRSELEVIGVPDELKGMVAMLSGRLAEALGHDKDALDDYRRAVMSPDRAAAAEAKLLEITLRTKRREISQADQLRELETLAVTWRGDDIEVRTLENMARIYSDTGHYGELLAAARTATKLQPNSEVSRQAQDAASALFSQIFLSSKGDDLPPVEALGMFYEFRELTPIGRRGDEMIRRLADRLVAVDLLDQAAELLQYQVDHRLEGAARAQVAAKLAMVYLTNRKPDRAIGALRSTRIADLAGELRQQRLLLEARAQSDVGRHDLALDIVSNIAGREAIRLRSDIYWASRRWRESAEQIELYYGERWREFKPLSSNEKSDVIRAAVGYALAEDAIGLARFREKYAALMNGDGDRLAFDVASKPAASSSAEFTEIAKIAASVDTLEGFLREMKSRFPDASAKASLPPDMLKADPASTGALPAIVGLKRVKVAR